MSKECEGHNKVEEILLWDVIKMEIRAAPLRKPRFKHKEYLLEEEVLVLDKNRSTTV